MKSFIISAYTVSMKRFLPFFIILAIVILIPNAFAQELTNVPAWIKNNAGWWADSQIDDATYISGLQWLISNGIIKIPEECIFEGEEYSHLHPIDRTYLCNEFNFSFVAERVTKTSDSATYNSEGFRGPEFLKEKPDNTYRIFVLGGSTTFGDGNDDNETWPYYLQEIFDVADLSYNVEVINAGTSSAWSGSETKMIREKILGYNPDMLMIYDGWNDVRMQLGEPQGRIANPEMANPTLWKEHWVESCEFTNANNVKTIVTLQPFLGTGFRTVSNQEMGYYNTNTYWIKNDVREYTNYQNQLEEISRYCTETKDLTRIFDQVDKPIYWDLGHVGSEANKIIATHFFKLALPYIPGNGVVMDSEIVHSFLQESSTKSQRIPKELDLRGKFFANEDFTNQDLRESVFHLSRLNNVNFSNADLENVDFGFTIMRDVNFNDANLKNAVFPRATITSSDFSSADLTNVDLSTILITDTIFTNSILSNSDFSGAELRYIDFNGANLENLVLERSVLSHIDMKNSKIKNMEISFSDFMDVDFNGVDFSEIVLGSQNSFAGSDFRNSNLPILQLVDTDFSSKVGVWDANNPNEGTSIGGANLSNLDFSNTDMSKVVFSYIEVEGSEDCGQSIYTRSILRNLQAVDLTEANLSGADLSGKNLILTIFYGTNLSNADLSNSDLRCADLRNTDLSGADLTNANLEFADASGVILDNTILNCKNHSICEDN